MIVSPGMSLAVAGVASGICLFLFSSMRKGRAATGRRKPGEIVVDDTRCGCCFRPFLLDRGVRCADCESRACRKGCSRWDTEESAWHCLFCHQQRCWLRRREKWFETFGGGLEEEEEDELHRHFSTAKCRVYVAGVENASSTGDPGAAEAAEAAHTMETVREFVEKIVESLIGNVDDTPINRLYEHPAYDKLLAKYLVPLTGALTRLAVALQLSLTNKPTADPPTMAHAALREIVERAVQEAKKLPGLASASDGRQEDLPPARSIVEHSYEDLLATAILNKVIEKFQRERVDSNSNVLLNEKLATRSKHTGSEYDFGLDEGVEEGCSSLEPLSQDECSDCSASCSRHLRPRGEPMSLTIEERIEEVTTTYGSDEEHRDVELLSLRGAHRVPFPELGMDIVDPSQEDSSETSQDADDEEAASSLHVDMVSPVESWKENWLFQRKRVQAQAADPVAMLVPHPSADYKALIGDKDAEDTSDLSECSSAQSDEEIEKELMEAISNVVPRSPVDGPPPGNYSTFSSLLNDTKEAEAIKEDLAARRVDPESKERVPSEEVERPTSAMPNGNGSEIVAELSLPAVQSEQPVRSQEEDEEAEEEVPKTEVALTGCLPRTPACTPIRTFSGADLESVNDAESLTAAADENVLNSLECAKKKLLVTGEQRLDAEEERIVECAPRKADFHVAEDAQQESEYTEHYDIATQRHMDSLTKTGEHEESLFSSLSSTSSSQITEEKPRRRSTTKDPMSRQPVKSHPLCPEGSGEEEEGQFAPPRPGTIAEREHKKWENAPPIENNPYSPESIQKRLLERQYSRRLSDIPGMHAELAKSNGSVLNAGFTPIEQDITRFGRDYYINNSKLLAGSRRPGSSLSQRSGSTISMDCQEYHQQHQQQAQEDAPLFSASKGESKGQKNNADTSSTQNNDELPPSNQIWSDRAEEIFETERKNSKNEINAKLNNQENYENGDRMLDLRRSNSEESRRKIRRIDLKAYGFENEFSPGSKTTEKPGRVVNKLDLKSFGYDGGLRRCQSNNHLERGLNDSDMQPRMVRATNKLNLARQTTYEDKPTNESRSSEALDKLHDAGGYDSLLYNPLKAAKSVPNIAKCEYYSSSSTDQDELESCTSQTSSRDVDELSIIMNGQVVKAVRNYKFERSYAKHREAPQSELLDNDELEKTRLASRNETEDQVPEKVPMDKRLPMPSVRKLAQAFSKPPEDVPPSLTKITRTNGAAKERSSTPEIHIVETPRQMHSLTARSLSKKFREGLRQIPNKVTSPPASHVAMEQPQHPEQTDVVQSKAERGLNDTAVISPGKLKSNIIFWEQLQRQA